MKFYKEIKDLKVVLKGFEIKILCEFYFLPV